MTDIQVDESVTLSPFDLAAEMVGHATMVNREVLWLGHDFLDVGVMIPGHRIDQAIAEHESVTVLLTLADGSRYRVTVAQEGPETDA